MFKKVLKWFKDESVSQRIKLYFFKVMFAPFALISGVTLIVIVISIFTETTFIFSNDLIMSIRFFWWGVVIPSALGSMFFLITDEEYNGKQFGNLKRGLTWIGYFLLFGGIVECLGFSLTIVSGPIFLRAQTIETNDLWFFIPIFTGLIPVLIDVFLQSDEEVK